MSSPPLPDLTGRLLPASGLTPRAVSWLWPFRLGLGKLAIFDGDPGLGKSLVALDLCARLSTGRPFPDGAASAGPACSIVLNAEDSKEDTVLARLQALGADLDRVFVLGAAEEEDAPLLFPGRMDVLEAALVRTQARLVVIDPIMAFLDASVNAANDQSVRRALRPLAGLAEKYGCVILLIRHINKSGKAQSLYRGGGSIGIVGACRSAWLFACDPEAPERRVMAQIKNNLAPAQPSLVYELSAPQTGPLSVHWPGQSPLTATQLLTPKRTGRPPVLRDQARDFLAALLEKGPRTSRDIWTEARQVGLTEHTLQRAKEVLEVRSVRVWANGQRLSYWLLPHQKLPDGVPAQDDECRPRTVAGAAAGQFPPSTPIDDL